MKVIPKAPSFLEELPGAGTAFSAELIAPQRAPEAADQVAADEVVDLMRRDDETVLRLSDAVADRVAVAPMPWHGRLLKRTVDVLGALALLLALVPVLAVVAIAIKVDTRGPVLFAQDRVGRGGRTFRILKLRSMAVDNDDSAHAEYVAKLIRGEADTEGGVFKLVSDPRVTRVGRFIRRYSIDELPQLWNVVRGDMSLVGPRPALPREVALYDAAARQRLAVKPGVTGLWQVSGRCELSFADMVALDVSYWQQWSLVQDLRILVRTPMAALSGRGAA